MSSHKYVTVLTGLEWKTPETHSCPVSCVTLRKHSYKKRKDSLEGSLDRLLFAVELEFPKILVPRLLQNTSNTNIEYARKSKQLYYLCDQLFGALIYLHFIVQILICFINARCKLSNIWLLLFTRAYHRTKNIVAVVTQDKVIYDNLTRQIKNRTLYTCRLFLLTWIVQYINELLTMLLITWLCRWFMLKYSMVITKHRYSSNQFFKYSFTLVVVFEKKTSITNFPPNVYYIV